MAVEPPNSGVWECLCGVCGMEARKVFMWFVMHTLSRKSLTDIASNSVLFALHMVTPNCGLVGSPRCTSGYRLAKCAVTGPPLEYLGVGAVFGNKYFCGKMVVINKCPRGMVEIQPILRWKQIKLSISLVK